MERMARIPSGFKLNRKQGKYIFKRALEKRLPHSILYRRKMGFSVPLAEWWRKDLKASFETSVLRSDSFCSGLFQPSELRSLWQQQQSGLKDNCYKLWILYALEKWAQNWAR